METELDKLHKFSYNTPGITNSVGRLSSAEIDQMIKDAEQFKNADKEFSARHEAKSDLEAYIHQVEGTITSPEIGMKLKRGAKGQVEAELARALEKLEIEDSTADELKKAQLGIKRALQKATAGIRWEDPMVKAVWGIEQLVFS